MSRIPRLSVIICVYDMPREAPRTILSAGVPYQQGIAADDYEVIVIDNGSTRPISESDRMNAPVGIRFVEMSNPKPSPVFAMNWAAREMAKGEILLFAIDGARIFSNRLYAATLAAHELVDDAFVYTLGWHLSSKAKEDSVTEDLAISASGWPAKPDGLFGIAVFAGACRRGFFNRISESNAFSMPRALFDRMGGYDQRFTTPGGGLANSEIFGRYVARPNARNICLLSEGTFHQSHGGAATSGKVPRETFEAEYRQIFGQEPGTPPYDTLYSGKVRPGADRFIIESLDFLK